MIGLFVATMVGIGFAIWLGSGFLSSTIDALSGTTDDAPASDDPSSVYFAVRPGASARQVADDLQRAGLITSAVRFRSLAESTGLDKRLQAGSFELRRNMTQAEVLGGLTGSAARRPSLVTIAEGWRAEEVALSLEAQGIVPAAGFIEAVSARRGSLPLPPGASSFEGYLFPDSYEFASNPTAEDVVGQLVDQFYTRVDGAMRSQAADRGLTVHELVTVASIIEREAVDPSERPRIARVVYNRLAAGMNLEADPTVQYALVPFGVLAAIGGYWRTELAAADLRVASPYNTYIQSDLPPGPICSPGLASLQAAANPEPGPWLYFVAKGDGSHLFATNLRDHLANAALVGR